MAKKPADHVAEAAAAAEKRRKEAAAAADEQATKLDAIREAGRLQREADLEDDRIAAGKAAAAEEKARKQAARQEREDAEKLHATVTRLLAEREAKLDAEYAAALAARLEAEKDTDPSLGPQTVLEPSGALARAARGGAARDMAGNALTMELATIAAAGA